MKGSVLTGRTLFLLGATALLVAAGALNFSQRGSHQAPPTDGVSWVDTSDGVVAKAVEPGSAAARARVIPGDRLIAISPNRSEEHTSELQSQSNLVCRLLLE